MTTNTTKMKKYALFAAIGVASAWPVIAWAVQPHGSVVHAEAAADGAGGAEEPEGHGHWPPAPINWTDFNKVDHEGKTQPPLFASIVNFVLLLGMYYAIGKTPIATALKTRRDSIAKEIEEAQRMKAEAEERAKMYQGKLARLEDELATAKEALVESGKGERDRIIRDAEEKAARMQKDASFLIEQEVRKLHDELWRGAVAQAIGAAEQLLTKRVTPADQERLAEEYLAELSPRARGTNGSPGAGAGSHMSAGLQSRERETEGGAL